VDLARLEDTAAGTAVGAKAQLSTISVELWNPASGTVRDSTLFLSPMQV
jgi:hypothetical protein